MCFVFSYFAFELYEISFAEERPTFQLLYSLCFVPPGNNEDAIGHVALFNFHLPFWCENGTLVVWNFVESTWTHWKVHASDEHDVLLFLHQVKTTTNRYCPQVSQLAIFDNNMIVFLGKL